MSDNNGNGRKSNGKSKTGSNRDTNPMSTIRTLFRGLGTSWREYRRLRSYEKDNPIVKAKFGQAAQTTGKLVHCILSHYGKPIAAVAGWNVNDVDEVIRALGKQIDDAQGLKGAEQYAPFAIDLVLSGTTAMLAPNGEYDFDRLDAETQAAVLFHLLQANHVIAKQLNRVEKRNKQRAAAA